MRCDKAAARCSKAGIPRSRPGSSGTASGRIAESSCRTRRSVATGQPSHVSQGGRLPSGKTFENWRQG